jgi:glycosyltransferase involved in cell wall biosynthesis
LTAASEDTGKTRKDRRVKLSVAIIVHNEADRLAACLQSARFADDIVLVDAGSQDETVALAESFGCRVFHQPFLGFARQKQWAVDRCRHDWVFILDADERIPPATAEAIRTALGTPHPEPAAFNLPRKNFLHQRWVRRCGWWPDTVTRLVDRRRGRFSAHAVHERWLARGEVQLLPHPIEHHSFRNYADMLQKLQQYSTLAAADMVRRKKRIYVWSPFLHGGWMFIHTYFLKLGILEGLDGFVISLLNSGGSFMKYAKGWEAQRYQVKT